MATLSAKGERASERAWTAGVFVAVTIWTMLFLNWNDYLKSTPAAEEPLIAMHLARGDGFLSPMSPRPDAPPTSWSPPVYPALLGWVTSAFSQGGVPRFSDPAVLTAMMVINSLTFGAMGAGIYRLGALLFSRAAGLISVALLSVHPLFLNFAGAYWDSYFALAMFFWLLVAAQQMPRALVPVLASIGMGIALGFLSLTNASYVLAYPLIVLYGLRGRPARMHWTGVAAAAIAFVLVLLPWTLRNYSIFREVYYVRGDLQLEMWIGNQPVSTGWLDPATLEEHPYRNPHERALLLNMGEAAYFRQCGERFADEISRDPTGFIRRCGYRFCYLFLSEPSRTARYPFMANIVWHKMVIDKVLLNAMVTLIGLAGTWTAWRIYGDRIWPLAAGILTVAPFTIAAVSDRYTLPLRAVLLFYGGFLVWAIAFRVCRGVWPARAS